MGHPRSTRTRSFVLVAVIALLLGALGSFGVSYAAGVTASQAKSIAKKVVKKQAKKLTVKNAKNLDGKPPSAYQDTSRVYYTTVASPVTSVLITIPGLSPGKAYQVSYAAFLYTASAGLSGCSLQRRTGGAVHQYYADDLGDRLSPGYSGIAVVTVPAGQTLALSCYASGGWITYDDVGSVDPIQIVVTELDNATVGTLPFATRGAGAPRP